jgi:hypothetical protein
MRFIPRATASNLPQCTRLSKETIPVSRRIVSKRPAGIQAAPVKRFQLRDVGLQICPDSTDIQNSR